MNMNIVILRIENGSPSGVLRYVQMLTEGLSCCPGISMHLVSLNANLIFPEFDVKDDRMIINIPYPSKSKPLKNELYWLNKYFNVITDLLFPCFKDKKRLVWHVQELFLVKLADMLKNALGGNVVTHLHIIPWKFYIEYDENYFRKLYSQWLNGEFSLISNNPHEKVAYSVSDKIICVSMSAKKHIISAYGVTPEKISVIYNGLKYTKTNFKKVEGEEIELLFVGRISREKGVICLLNALKKVYRRGYLCRLNLVGQCSNKMLTYIQEVYNDLNIKLIGVIPFEELKGFYKKNVIGIIPSLHEQCSYSAIEMSMFGIPMILSDVDALSEMFEDEVNALKIPLSYDKDFGLELNEEKLADAIIRLLEDEGLRQRMSVNVVRNYCEKFTLDKMVMNMINVYKQLV